MSGISDAIQSGKESVFGFADDLSNVLDFGTSAPPNDPIKPVNPEADISEIDRSNPVNVEYSSFGLPPYVLYGGAAIVGLILLKKFKVF